jgi:hypothetical protein
MAPSPFADNAKRTIPANFKFDPHSLKPLAQTLWALSISLGHTLTAHRQFARVKSATVSPDGMLGGRGYVMGVKDIRQRLYEASEALSAICDTIHDEINAPHWKPRLAELEKDEADDLKRLLTDAEDNLQNPEEEAEEDMAAVEHGEGGGKPPGEGKDVSWKPGGDDRFDKQEPASAVPAGGDQETLHRGGPKPPSKKQASSRYSYDYTGGPVAESGMPDSGMDLTPTDANDYGLGFGAHGDGIAQRGQPGGSASTLPHLSGGSELPNDGEDAVDRSDYYRGPKGNGVATGPVSESELPSADGGPPTEDIDLPNTSLRGQDPSNPHPNWDSPVHETYIRDPYQRLDDSMMRRVPRG